MNYGLDISEEGRLITKAILEATIEGVGKLHKTSVFPCQIFQMKKGVNTKEGEPNYDLFKLALKCTAKRLYPNYGNCDWSNQKEWVEYDRKCKRKVINEMTSENKELLKRRLNSELKYYLMLDDDLNVVDTELPFEYFATMGCRTVNGADINAERSYMQNIESVLHYGKLSNDIYSSAQKDGRGNICPVTIILPTLAMQANGDVEKFMEILEENIKIAQSMLFQRYKHICTQSPRAGAFMYQNGTMSGFDGVSINSSAEHGTLAVGMLGLSNCLYALIGKDQTTEEGMELAKRICNLYKTLCDKAKKQTHLNYGVYFTPECKI